MKTCFIITLLLVGAGAWGQPAEIDHILRTQIPRHYENRSFIEGPAKPNEIVGNTAVYTGIAVEAIKVDNPLQLINPLAPPQYGSGKDNLSRDGITGKVIGLNFLSVNF